MIFLPASNGDFINAFEALFMNLKKKKRNKKKNSIIRSFKAE